jgi:hypothetical protein
LTNLEDFLSQGREAASTTPGHEPDVIQVRRLVLLSTGLVFLMILVAAILTLVMNGFSRIEQRQRLLTPPHFSGNSGEFLAPALQPDPSAELAALKADEQARLNHYGWVDRDAGIAHIPISRAIEILAKTGLPVPAQAATPEQKP